MQKVFPETMAPTSADEPDPRTYAFPRVSREQQIAQFFHSESAADNLPLFRDAAVDEDEDEDASVEGNIK